MTQLRKPFEIRLFVCSDLVLITKPSGAQFKVHDVIALNSISLFDLRADPKQPPNSFRVASSRGTYVPKLAFRGHTLNRAFLVVDLC